ncbi:MAG: hemolysin activation/secretion protein [Candidatus Omnitrophota bacterium]|jgi:hemolysin activation/secretion protein
MFSINTYYKIYKSVQTRLIAIGLGIMLGLSISSNLWAEDSELKGSDTITQMVSELDSFIDDIERDTNQHKGIPIDQDIIDSQQNPDVPDAIGNIGPSFYLTKLDFEGMTRFNDQDMQPYSKLFIKTEVNIGDIKRIAKRITQRYQAAGYITSRAYVPPQTILDGIVRIKILEGKIGTIHIEDNHFFKDGVFEQYLKLDDQSPFNYKDFESALYNLNALPDLSVKSYLLSGDAPGTTDILLKAVEKNPLHISYNFHNRGVKSTHLSRHALNIRHSSLTGRADMFSGSYFFSEEGAFGGISLYYKLPRFLSKSDFSINANLIQSMLINHFKSTEVKSKSTSLNGTWDYHLIANRDIQFKWVTRFDYKDSKTSVNDNKLSLDRLRILSSGFAFTNGDALGQWQIQSALHWGVPDFWGGSQIDEVNSARTGTGGQFNYVSAQATRIHRLPHKTLLILRGTGQATNDLLPTLEQFRAGGRYSVRGYPESDSGGDYGYNFSAEVQIPLNVNSLPLINFKKTKPTIRGALFYDTAKTFLKERRSESANKDRYLAGIGLGLRINLGSNLNSSLDWGFPIGDSSTDEDKSRFHFDMTYSF